MADQSDVETALVGLITAGLYPSGVSGAAALSTAGMVCSVSRGWPDPQSLDAALAASVSWVTVYAPAGMSRLTSRYAPTWQQISANVPTVTATASGSTVTFGGTVSARNVVGVQFGAGKLKSGYSYRFTGTDTLAAAASALAARIAGASAFGSVLSLPGGTVGLSAAVVVDQQAQIELRRQAQEFRLICWCPTPAARDALAAAVDLAVAGQLDANGNPTEFMPLPDGTSVRLTYRNGYTMDGSQKDGLWRRDLCYTAEYATTLVQTQPELLFLVENVTAQGQPVTSLGVTDIP